MDDGGGVASSELFVVFFVGEVGERE